MEHVGSCLEWSYNLTKCCKEIRCKKIGSFKRETIKIWKDGMLKKVEQTSKILIMNTFIIIA